jgi:hypothetical protein
VSTQECLINGEKRSQQVARFHTDLAVDLEGAQGTAGGVCVGLSEKVLTARDVACPVVSVARLEISMCALPPSSQHR